MSDKKVSKKNDIASKIRHDINNHLTVISGFAQLLRMKQEENSKEYEWLENILKETEKIKKITKKIK